MNPKREREIADALMGPPSPRQDEMGMKPMAPNNMEIAVDTIHLLSGELKQKNKVVARVLQESEAIRSQAYIGRTILEYVNRVLDGVATPEGQDILRRYHGLKAKDKKKFEEAKHKALVQLREYLLKAQV